MPPELWRRVRLVNGDQLVVYRSEGEWSALYVDGRLNRVGDSYLIDERVLELLGVEERHSDDFLMGQDTSKGCAQTLTELEKYREAREAREAEAARLRAEADELLERAATLDPKTRR